MFVKHTVESAPAGARRFVEATVKHRGYLPAAVGLLASSPHLLEGFLKVSALFEASTLDPLAREVVILTMATRNGCHLCVAMHTARLTELDADPATISALRNQEPLEDERLEAVRAFTIAVLGTTGDVSEREREAFLSHGYTPQNALEVVLGIGAYTMSTLANRLTGAPIDAELAQYA
ncbi:carboxymuconolactone decarboxylase family protein [Amycolatopsis sp. CA-230715]|uniref:carboxymuconolactone decarboxylase family protein n=1 Tax=Amycolatopsis sp. CA-230715 TaxID=2745196 RepID=UPI001C022492|nr:carboxymuconolactone decarboxylase family protein [Amycolatopsis sp. CA-230715]QWF80666.1 hypothetical protein HUW46_04089 [Amycolatopsis sp. CA-230715]